MEHRPPPGRCLRCGEFFELNDTMYDRTKQGLPTFCPDCWSRPASGCACPACHGSGSVSVPMRATSDYHRMHPSYRSEPCWHCGGTGRTVRGPFCGEVPSTLLILRKALLAMTKQTDDLGAQSASARDAVLSVVDILAEDPLCCGLRFLAKNSKEGHELDLSLLRFSVSRRINELEGLADQKEFDSEHLHVEALTRTPVSDKRWWQFWRTGDNPDREW